MGKHKFSAPPAPKESDRLWLGLLFLAGAAAYANSLPGMLFWDNEILILKNVFLRSFRYLPQIFTTSVMAGGGEVTNYYRPVPVALLLVQFQLWGAAPLGYHAVNILVHLLNAALVFTAAKALLKDPKAALLAALLFVLHPIQNETVNYIDHVEGMLALTFGLLAFVGRLKGRFFLSLASWILCLLCKEEGLIFLIWLGLYELNREGEDKPAARLRGLWPYTLVAGVYVILHLTVFNFLKLPITGFGAQPGAYSSLPRRLLTFAQALVVYGRLLVWPTGLHFDRDMETASFRDPWAWGGLMLAGAAIALLGSWARRDRTARLGLAWFLAALLPYCGLVPFNNILAEHFLYIPSVGLFLCLAALAAPRLGSWPRPLLAAVFFSYVLVNIARNRDWQDPVRIYMTTLRGNPKSYRAANNLGVEHFRAGRMPQAAQAFELALKAKADYAPALNNLGAIVENEKRLDEALVWYQRSAAADPTYSLAFKNAAGILLDKKRYAEAESWALGALKLYPQYADALEILGSASFFSGKLEQSASAFEQAVAIRPNAQAYHNLSVIYDRLGRRRESVAAYEAMRRLGI